MRGCAFAARPRFVICLFELAFCQMGKRQPWSIFAFGHHSQYSEELTNEYGKGFSVRSLRLCRQVFLAFPSQEIWQTRLPNLTWSHYVELLRVEIVT